MIRVLRGKWFVVEVDIFWQLVTNMFEMLGLQVMRNMVRYLV